ncbi:MAG: hypothetical protein ABIZ36_08530 [Gemmatimonadaceae bacterium]
MAEIPIERKPRRSVTPLLLALLVILLIVAGWYWWTTYGGGNQSAGTTTSSIATRIHVATISIPTTYNFNFRRV